MQPEDSDDLFRQQLGGHATPPSPELQHRLDALAADERLDALFRTGLASHATPPPRALWERLEDEHLHPQPRRRRAGAWWQYMAAAVVLLLLLAGGATLWRGRYPAGPGLASTRLAHPGASRVLASARQPGAAAGPAPPATRPAAKNSFQSLGQKSLTPPVLAATKKKREILAAQATAPLVSSSSPSIATTTRPRRGATARRVAGRLLTQGQQPDAAASPLATTGGPKTPAASQHLAPAPVATTLVAPAPRAEPPALAAAPAGVIEVDVRRGAEAAGPAPTTVAVVPARRPRLRLGGLLRQADHLVHGEPVRLAEATGLPETVTLQARLGGRVISKSIQL